MVKLTIKTIKGKKFHIEAEKTQTVREVKGVIEGSNPEFPAAQLKLIHSGQILKDESTLEEYKIKDDEFLVCMVTKPKPAAAAGAAGAPATPAASAAPAPSTSPAMTPVALAAAAPPAATPGAHAAAATVTARNANDIRQLTDMGFPEDQATAALRASLGNMDVAVEFLMTGIPDNVQAASASAAQSPAAASGVMETLDDFRGHPQFNELKRLVQRDPAMLSNVLQMIGQQSPTLLARIHENQAEFIELMNEPVGESAPPAAAAAPAGGPGNLDSMISAGGQPGNPAQVAQMLQGLTPAQRAQMAAVMGVSPQQLSQVSQVIGQMPQEQFQQLMGMVSAGGMPGGGMGGMRAMPPGAGGPPDNVIRLTEEEGAAVARLSELGFDRSDAAQAYLACDKNEALAANLLMDGMGAGMQPAFNSPALPTSAPPPAPPATPAAPSDAVLATTATSESATPPSATESAPAQAPDAATPAPASGESPPTDPPADGQAQGGDEDEDMYG